MPDRAIVVLILAAVALVMTLAIMNANSVIRIGRPRPDQESAYGSEPVSSERRGRVVRVVRTRRRIPGRRRPADEEIHADHDPRFIGPPPVDPWYARGWRARLRRRITSSATVPVVEHLEPAPVDGDDGTGNPSAEPEEDRLAVDDIERQDEHDRLI